MRKNRFFVVGALGLILGMAGTAQGGDPTSDLYGYCGGAGWTTVDANGNEMQIEASVDQKILADGTIDIDGKIIWKTEAGPKMRAWVDCMYVDGWTATLLGTVYAPDEHAGRLVLVTVHDQDYAGLPDEVSLAMDGDILLTDDPTLCGTSSAEVLELVQGNFGVWGPE
jgi:hypothetical protein